MWENPSPYLGMSQAPFKRLKLNCQRGQKGKYGGWDSLEKECGNINSLKSSA
jgi:hypothetical protein